MLTEHDLCETLGLSMVKHVCIKCGVALVIEENWSKQRKRTCMYVCDTCTKARRSAYYAPNRTEILTHKKAYRKANKRKVLLANRRYHAAYYKANRGRVLSHVKAYYEAHRAERLAYAAGYRADPINKKRKSRVAKAYRKAHRIEFIKKDRAYYASHIKEAAQRGKTRNSAIVRQTIQHYSHGTMACANPYGIHRKPFTELDALVLDHINDNAAKERKHGHGRGSTSVRVYCRYVITGRWPKGYRVLCMGCNVIKEVEHQRNNRKRELLQRYERSDNSKIDFIRHYSNGTMACADPYGVHAKYDWGPFMDIRGLSGDHVNGDGAEWRRKLGVRTSIKTYRMAKELNWPPIFQVLCMSCQLIKKRRNREYGNHKQTGPRSAGSEPDEEKIMTQTPAPLICATNTVLPSTGSLTSCV